MRKTILLAILLSFCAGKNNRLKAQSDLVITTDRSKPFGFVTFEDSVRLSNIGDAHHVDGYVKKNGNSFYVYPVGYAKRYRPFGANGNGTIGAYFKDSPEAAINYLESKISATSVAAEIKSVSNSEFWHIKGDKSTKLTLSWDSDSHISELTTNSLASLSIVGWNPLTNKWERIISRVDEISLSGAQTNFSSGAISSLYDIIPDKYSAITLGATHAPAELPSYSGELEIISCSEIRGWVWDANSPGSSLIIELIKDDLVFATINSNEFREDLQKKNGGTGNYGFRIKPPSLIFDGVTHEISARVKGSTYTLNSIGTPNLSCFYAGSFALNDCYNVSGWALDKEHLDTQFSLEILDGANVIDIVKGDRYLDSLRKAGYGSGEYGFNYLLGERFRDGQPHRFAVRVKETNFHLAPFYKTVNCPQSSYLGNYEVADCNTIGGWVWDRLNPGAALTVEVYEGSVVYGSGLANIYRESLKNSGTGTGQYGFSIPLPAALRDGKAHQLNVRVKGTSYVIGTARTVTCAGSMSRTGITGDGGTKSGEVRRSDINLSSKPIVFPNPSFGGKISLAFTAKRGEIVNITIVNSFGVNVFRTSLNGIGSLESHEVEVEDVASGTYYVVLGIGSTRYIQKVVIVK